MYLITGTYSSEGKIKCSEIVYHFYIKSRTETILTVSDRWREFLCPFGRKEPGVRKSRYRKIERFEFTPVTKCISKQCLIAVIA